MAAASIHGNFGYKIFIPRKMAAYEWIIRSGVQKKRVEREVEKSSFLVARLLYCIVFSGTRKNIEYFVWPKILDEKQPNARIFA